MLVVPSRTEVDQFGETYFFFQGLSLNDALAGHVEGRWATLYDQCQALNADSGQPWMAHVRQMLPDEVTVGMVVVESHNGVRNRVAEVHADTVLVVPIDNPLPSPRGNAPGRKPTRYYVDNIVGHHLLLTDPELAALDTVAYAARFGLGNEKIVWLSYDETSGQVEA